ncbi:MAG: sugar ABC transporter permease [Actinomycetota bacterium]
MNKRTFWAFTLPSVAVMLILMVFPLVTTLWLSMNRLLIRDLDNPEWVGFANYSDTLNDPEFWSAVWFTLRFVAITVPINMVVGLGIALLLDRVGKRTRPVYMAALLLPFIVTPVVGTSMFKELFERGGLLSWLWTFVAEDAFAITDGNVQWLIFIHAVWYTMPFAMITFFAGLQTLPQDRVEAASIDGAGFWRSLWYVTIPHLRTLLLFVGLISVMDAYRVFDSVFVFAGTRFQNVESLQVYNFRVALDSNIGRIGKGNAIGILNVIGIFVVLIPFLYRSYKDQIAERS